MVSTLSRFLDFKARMDEIDPRAFSNEFLSLVGLITDSLYNLQDAHWKLEFSLSPKTPEKARKPFVEHARSIIESINNNLAAYMNMRELYCINEFKELPLLQRDGVDVSRTYGFTGD